MAVKFPLKMSGVDVRTLEDLHKHFDIIAVIDYYKSGKLLKWLEDRYYDEEAEKIEGLDANSTDFNQRLCEVFGVEYDASNATNAERLKEKKKFLQQHTTEKTIIDNADKTALNQEDLADLLDTGKPTIYLYGGSVFNVPIRVANKNYVGILGTPTINIRANSQTDLDTKNISFENCKLPWTNTTNFTKKEYQSTARTNSTSKRSSVNSDLIDTFEVIFGHRKVWSIFDRDGNILDKEPTAAQKRMFLKMVCNGEYEESDLIHLCATEDFTAGWAFTKDSFCVGGEISLMKTRYVDNANFQHKKKIFYSEIAEAKFINSNTTIEDNFGFFQRFAMVTRNQILSDETFREFVIVDTSGDTWQFYCEPDFSNVLNQLGNDFDMSGENFFDDGSFSQYGIKFLPNDGSINEPVFESNTTFKSLTDRFAMVSDDIKIKIAKFLNFAKA